MTADQIAICMRLGACTMLPGSFDKRMSKNLSALAKTNPEKELSEKQNEWMFRLLYKYRKQLPQTYQKHQNNPLCSRLK